MSAFKDFHPLTKEAALATQVGTWLSTQGSKLTSAVKNIGSGQWWKQTARANRLGIAGGATGLAGGGILGNVAYNASIPEVNVLPEYYPPDKISVPKYNYQNAEY